MDHLAEGGPEPKTTAMNNPALGDRFGHSPEWYGRGDSDDEARQAAGGARADAPFGLAHSS